MADQSCMLGGRGRQRQDRGCAFGGDGQDPGGAGFDAFARLQGVEIVGQQVDVGLADALGEHDAVGFPLHDHGEIAQRKSGVERIDAHIELGPGATGRLQVGQHHVARDLLAVGSDRILEVEDQPVGTGRRALGELALGIAGNEQERTHLS